MKKKDLTSMMISGSLGLGVLFTIFWWARRTTTVPVISPVAVKWEEH
jgi:hypothetical protein